MFVPDISVTTSLAWNPPTIKICKRVFNVETLRRIDTWIADKGHEANAAGTDNLTVQYVLCTLFEDHTDIFADRGAAQQRDSKIDWTRPAARIQTASRAGRK